MKNLIKLTIILVFFVSTKVYLQNWNALCVGINDYPGTTNDLGYCVNDAYDTKNSLINNNNWNSTHVSILTDGDATETNIRSSVSNLPIGQDSSNFFHFSGHGGSEEIGNTDGLIPSNSISARITPDELQDDFGETFNKFTCFLDACGTGIFPRDMTNGVVVSACKANEYSWESPSLQHGIFSYYLLQGLSQSNVFAAEHLYNYAASLTSQYASSLDPPRSQHPQISDNFNGDLLFTNELNGSISISSTVTIPNNHSLTIGSNSNITFTDNSSLVVNQGGNIVINSNASVSFESGTLQINGTITADCSNGQISFNSTGSSKWGGIRLNSSASSSSVIKYCDINNANQGIYVDGSINFPTIEHNTITNCNDGIYLYNAEGSDTKPVAYNNISGSVNGLRIEGITTIGAQRTTWITNNTVTSNDNGLVLRYSHPKVYNNTISCNDYGLKTEDYSYPKLAHTTKSGGGYNRITDSYSTNIWVDNHSGIWSGEQNEVNEGIYGGYNTFGSDDDASNPWTPNFINANNYSSLIVNYTYFGSFPPVSGKIITDATSSVDYSNYLSSDPTTGASCSQLASAPMIKSKSDGNEIMIENPEIDSTGGFATIGIGRNKRSVLLYFGIHHYLAEKYDSASTVFKNIITTYPDTKEAVFALNWLAKIYNETGSTETLTQAHSYLTGFENNYGPASENSIPNLYESSLPILAGINFTNNNSNAAMGLLNKIINKFDGSENSKYALYKKLIYYANSEGDINKANSVYAELKSKFPKDPILVDALITLGEDPSEMLDKVSMDNRNALAKSDADQTEEENDQEDMVKDFSLKQNFPNPFNPATTIKYQTPISGEVKLEVFDVLGRRVAELVNTTQSKGRYQINFNTNDSKISSGIYYYSIVIKGNSGKNFRDVKKMIVLK